MKILALIIQYLPKLFDFISRQFGMGYNKEINDFADENKGGKDHLRYIQDDKGFKLRYTKWDDQKDNKYNAKFPMDKPYNGCFYTSIAVQLRTMEQPSYGGQGRRKYLSEDSEDRLLEYLQQHREEHRKIAKKLTGSDMLPRYLYKWWEWFINEKVDGYKAQYKVFTRQGLVSFIQQHKIPVVIGTYLTSCGHVVMAIGGNDKGLWVQDSFGDRNFGYKKSKSSGKEVFYTWDLLGKKKFNSIVIVHEK